MVLKNLEPQEIKSLLLEKDKDGNDALKIAFLGHSYPRRSNISFHDYFVLYFLHWFKSNSSHQELEELFYEPNNNSDTLMNIYISDDLEEYLSRFVAENFGEEESKAREAALKKKSEELFVKSRKYIN